MVSVLLASSASLSDNCLFKSFSFWSNPLSSSIILSLSLIVWLRSLIVVSFALLSLVKVIICWSKPVFKSAGVLSVPKASVQFFNLSNSAFTLFKFSAEKLS